MATFEDWRDVDLGKLAKKAAALATAFRVVSALVRMDYEILFKDLIAAAAFDWKHPEFTRIQVLRHIFEYGQRTIRFEVIYFRRVVTAEEALFEMGACGLRPATLLELLAFAAKYRNMQLQFPVVCLGTELEILGFKGYAFLDELAGGRALDISFNNIGWSELCLFLAVKK